MISNIDGDPLGKESQLFEASMKGQAGGISAWPAIAPHRVHSPA